MPPPPPIRLDRHDAIFSARTTGAEWQRILEVRDQPRYLDGVVRYDEMLPDLFGNNIILSKAVTEISRFKMIVVSLHLYDTADPDDPTTGLTLSRLQKLCKQHGFASSTGVATFLGLLLVAGYLERQRSACDTRIVHLVPTPKFIAIVERWNRAMLLSLDAIEPEGGLARLHEIHPRFGWDVRKGSAEFLLGGWKPLEPFPEVVHFLDCTGGWMLLCRVVATMFRDTDRSQIVPVDVDLAAFGNTFGVSRTNLRRMLESAHDKGLLAAAPRNGRHILLSQLLLDACMGAQASELATYRRAAHAVKASHSLCTRADVGGSTRVSAREWP
jgi:hypothetical protein